MAVPSVRSPAQTKLFSSLKNNNIIRGESPPGNSIVTVDEQDTFGYVLYESGEQPEVESIFARLQFKLENEITVPFHMAIIGIIMNYNDEISSGNGYAIYLGFDGEFMMCQITSGSFTIDELNDAMYVPEDAVPLEISGDISKIINEWCTLDLNINDDNVEIYLYDSDGDIITSGEVMKIPPTEGLIGAFGYYVNEMESQPLNPIFNSLYLDIISPY